jgi:hypothetical protein
MSAAISRGPKSSHLKWMLIGLGSMFGLQIIISLIFTAIAFLLARSSADVMQNTVVVATFGLMLGAFLVGGFIIGWWSGQKRILDSILVAVITVALSIGVYAALPASNKEQFISGYLLSSPARGSLLFVLAIVAAAIGAYWGWHLTLSEEEVLEETSISPERRVK